MTNYQYYGGAIKAHDAYKADPALYSVEFDWWLDEQHDGPDLELIKELRKALNGVMRYVNAELLPNEDEAFDEFLIARRVATNILQKTNQFI